MRNFAFLFLALFSLGWPFMAHAQNQTAHSFSFPAIDGGDINLADFAGKTVLIVNTASACGFTGQYDGLQSLWETYRDKGLVVLAVPSNDFGAQETGTNDQIKSFCEVNFNIDFPITEKQTVKGDEAHPFFTWVVSELGKASRPRWNFYKYLIGPDGRAIEWYSSMTSPESRKLIRTIETALQQNQAAS